MDKVSLKRLTIEGFRGILKPVVLEFPNNAPNLVLYGNNGDGKSSFTDAIEWFFTDEIEDLRKEGCGREDYFNKALPDSQDATVTLEFDDVNLSSVKTLKRKGGYYSSNQSEEFNKFIEEVAKESFILRHSTIGRFVDKTKSEKLEDIEEIVGFRVVTEMREILLKVYNALKDDKELIQNEARLQNSKEEIGRIIGRDTFEIQDIISYAEQIRAELKHLELRGLTLTDSSTEQIRAELKHPQPITDFESLIAVANTLDEQTLRTDKGKKRLAVEVLQRAIEKIRTPEEICNQLKTIAGKHNKLVAKPELLAASAWEGLYAKAQQILSKGWGAPNKCPLCKSKFDTLQLQKTVEEEVIRLEALLKEKKELIDSVKQLRVSITSSMDGIQEFESEENKKLLTLPDELNQIINWLNRLNAWNDLTINMQKVIEPTEVGVPNDESLRVLSEAIQKTRGKLAALKDELSDTEEEKIFYRNVARLDSLRDNFIKIQRLNQKIEKFREQISSMWHVLRDFENREKEGLNAVISVISSDVEKFFARLHLDEKIDQIQLIQTELRGVEFKLLFHGLEISPPRKVLSESHMNSLGICLFLAFIRYFNKVSNFIILDDVISSFDSNHRFALARLLRDEFSDVQILLFTHDDLWFEELKKTLSPTGKWRFRGLKKWSIERGVEVIESPATLDERIKWQLERNNIHEAANRCRTLIEELLKDKCSKLGVKSLEFRVGPRNDQREASELLDGLRSYINENQSLRSKDGKAIFDDLRASQLLTNLGSHHRNMQSTTLSRGDVETVLRDIDEFKALFVCPSCNTEACKKYSPNNAKLKQCRCGNLKI
ncbi:hypothetical protein CEE36_03250 [candidate division TA06 bacterium B3_TA06]|uniref:RecF/RecN/SMC N-terminal domain-containing protein n=1 Tax=candidate division TA06 bacterium B3_TA06 TaxID=2012487 RepID=A0A532V965_UNCT6|nr:MAG: hypothetical protein CEE36_03250 [candidate division TA06 bacterium B3_TA06]